MSDAFGNAEIPVYCLNVTYPLLPDEVAAFCLGKTAVMIVEEGQPEFIEHELNTLVRRADLQTRIVGKDVLPRAGEYTGQVLVEGLTKFLRTYAPALAPTRPHRSCPRPSRSPLPRCRSGPRASAPAARSARSSPR